ncbi:MAG: DinB family protein [Vicinamibacterales bacterium]
MTPKTIELVHHLDSNRLALRRAVDDVPPALRGRRPGADRWSVAQVLEHLAIVEGRVTHRMTAALEAARAGGIPADDSTASVVDRSFLDRAADRTNRFKTSEAAEPRDGLTADAAWSHLEGTRAAFKELLQHGDGLALDGLVAPHPFFGMLNFYQWAAFLAAHDARHASQIREIHVTLAASEAS